MDKDWHYDEGEDNEDDDNEEIGERKDKPEGEIKQ
jgi:hypothetical protein